MTTVYNTDTTTHQDLAEPLLSFSNGGGEHHDDAGTNNIPCISDITTTCGSPSSSDNDNGDDDGNNNDGTRSQEDEPFSVQNEIIEMFHLGFPLAVSFFCRMGMASTDSAFVGHIEDGRHAAETYLAAAVLSDMVLNICITPPLAFNQVLNGLVSQAIGSNNPAMAGVWLQQSMFWLSVTMLPCLVGLFYVKPILEMLGFPSDIAVVAGTYAKFNLIWPIPNGLYQCMRFYFQARGLPRPAMYNNLIFLLINALLNWVLVFGGPTQWGGLGFIGAAISLSISRTMQGICYYLYMFVYKKHHIAAWPEGGWSFKHHTKDRTKEFMKQSLPNIGTLLFQAFASQATTVLVGRLGELSIAASSALSTVTFPWGGTLSATCTTVTGVRVGYHLGRGDGVAAKRSSWIVMQFLTIVNMIIAALFLIPFIRDRIMDVATDDENVVSLAETLVPAMLVGTYLNLLVSNGTSGVFSGQGRPLIATILSFGLELPLSIGGVAIYILVFHGNLLGVYWFNAIAGAIEAVIVFYLIGSSDWSKCAQEAQERQEAARNAANNDDDEDDDPESSVLSAATTDPESSSSDENDEEDAPLVTTNN
jgi:MATE family multidrug resistance protein